MWNSSPRDRFYRLVVSTLHDVINDSRPGSPIRQAYDGLGEHFIEEASRATYQHAKRELGRRDVLEAIEGRSRDAIVFVASRTAEIVQRALLDLIKAWEGRRYVLDDTDCGSYPSFLDLVACSSAELEGVRTLRVGDRLILRSGSIVTVVLEAKQGATHAA